MRTNILRAFISLMLLSFFVVCAINLLIHVLSLTLTFTNPDIVHLPTTGEVFRGFAIVLGFLILITILMSAFDTVLPAIFDGGDKSLQATWPGSD